VTAVGPAPEAVANRGKVTPLVLAWNEAPNIRGVLGSLAWAEQILVVDSGSTDGTLEFLAGDPRVRTVHRAFDNHADQWNFGVDQVGTPWVLALDADYRLPAGFAEELDTLDLEHGPAAWSASFHYVIAGKRLRGTLYPPRALLFDRSRCRYEADGHTQRLKAPGPCGKLASVLDHDDRKSLRRWFEAQANYAELEAAKLLAARPQDLRLQDRLRLWILPAPPLVLLYSLVLKGCLMDGWRGWYYALQRGTAELFLSLELLDRRLRR
jgi:glycosyltransferase involved in cell wall biosynthesis